MTSGKLLIVGFEGTRAPVELLRKIADGRVGGVVLFARNLGTFDEIAALNRELQAAVPSGDPPLLISLDQEGGRVQRVKAPFPHWPPMAKLGARDDAALSRKVGAAMGEELLALGFNVDWAPVLDVHSNPANPVIGDRAFSPDAAMVARHALEFWMGLESAGVRGCGKHFPGHGDTATDSHLTLPVVERPLQQLRQVELAPFAEAARVGVPMMMTAHVVFNAVDEKPATLSRRFLTDIMRGELGFRGLVVSDDLDMKAVAERFSVESVVKESLKAGCDVFLACRDAAVQQKAEEALQQADAERVADALARMQALRATLQAPGDWRTIDLAAHRALADSI
jgi:beta-N-acetylhexosaminidase